MAVHNGLASGSSNIEPDIVPGGFRIFFDYPFTFTDQSQYRTFFLTGQVEKILHMTEQDHQHMTFGNRKPVLTGIT
jgi:hypothetical protein